MQSPVNKELHRGCDFLSCQDLSETCFFRFGFSLHLLNVAGVSIENFENPLLGLWREAILTQWKRVPKAVDYFQHQVMFKKLVHENLQAAALFKDMPKIDQDPTHSLWFGYGNEPYEEVRYKELASVAFFTKTTYKSKMAKSPLPGSIAEYMCSRYKS